MASTGEPFGLFWNDDNGDRTYNADSMERWLKKFFTSGVFNGDLQVQASSGMTLEIGSGYTNADGKVKFWNAPFNITLDAANSTYPRIDTIVITRDNVNREILCEKVTGQYSADAPQPTAPVRNSEIFQLVIAQIYIPVGATEITQSNITDTRPDPDLCGYITGTVTEMDFSQFSAQFEAYYNEFVAGHEADFDTWEATQQAAYAAWYAEVVAQMQDDHEAFNEWFENLQNQLDTDQLTHLQAEIDDIYTMLPAGSHITVTTEETTLHSMDVTISDGEHTITSEFDNNGVAVFKTLPYVGNFMISSTDGNDTAHTTVTIPYYGRYAYEIAFWNAYVDIDGGDALAGADVVVTNSEDVEVATITLNNHGLGTFNAKEPDYYTFTAEYTGGVAIAEVDVQEQMHYPLTMYAGWKTWVELGGLSPSSYETLEDVFDDEVAVRRLMTIHASADYLIAMASADITILDDFVANDTAMKWIGLRDYVCDGLTNIAGVEAMFMASDYWERYLKDHVPLMTSNSAPYGTVVAKNEYNSGTPAWLAFDGENGTSWQSTNTGIDTWIQYVFLAPIDVKKCKVAIYKGSADYRDLKFKIQGSNDGSAFTDLTSELTFTVGTSIGWYEAYFNIENSNYYRYIRLVPTYANYSTGSASRVILAELQFYGRALNVSVPIMTSNTAPYGVAGADNYKSGCEPYKAFNGSSSQGTDAWRVDGLNNKLWYDFGRPVKALLMQFSNSTDSSYATTSDFEIVASNDGTTFVSLGTKTGVAKGALYPFTFANENAYRYYGIKNLNKNNTYSSGDFRCDRLQFFGVDYSEREFETGSNIKYLYDHGVELETINIPAFGSAYGSVTKENSQIKIQTTAQVVSAGDYLVGFNVDAIDLTPYNNVFMVVGDVLSSTTNRYCLIRIGGQKSGDSILSQTVIPPIYFPNYADISAADQAYQIGIVDNADNKTATVNELWLE